jgi:hypothetical protein
MTTCSVIWQCVSHTLRKWNLLAYWITGTLTHVLILTCMQTDKKMWDCVRQCIDDEWINDALWFSREYRKQSYEVLQFGPRSYCLPKKKPMQNIRRLIRLLLGVGHHYTHQVNFLFFLLLTDSFAEDTFRTTVLTESSDFRLSNFKPLSFRCILLLPIEILMPFYSLILTKAVKYLT